MKEVLCQKPPEVGDTVVLFATYRCKTRVLEGKVEEIRQEIPSWAYSGAIGGAPPMVLRIGVRVKMVSSRYRISLGHFIRGGAPYIGRWGGLWRRKMQMPEEVRGDGTL